jgi:succinate-semialdehyde dehydrogenase/glutarate-semialdehyde dehydrogenase
VLVRPTGQRSIVIPQPVGPTATFTPWNFPIYLLAKKVAAALAAGCTVISKPPEETPGCTGALAKALDDAGIPKGVFQLVHGVPDAVSRQLIGSPVIRKISFTGSTAVGKHLMKLAADGMKRITMELGGHAPVLVFDDCDLDKTLDMLVPQKFRNAGQVCVSPTRFFVQEGIYEAFAKGFAERTRG